MTIKIQKTNISKFFLFISTLILSANLFAQAGTSLFTYGKVQLRTNSGVLSDLGRGMNINTGDTVLTGINGRAQIRMQDGAIFDLKPNTEFLIEDYLFNQSSNAVANTVNAKENKGFYRLVRGGFRSISGLIGKRNKKNYRVKTPVATIGIRGTDYTATLCEQNCGINGRGLYLSVADGGVLLANDGGSLDIDLGATGFVANSATAPVAISSASDSSSTSDSTDDSNNSTASLTSTEATDATGNSISLDSGNDIVTPQAEAPPQATGVAGRIVASVDGSIVMETGEAANIVLGQNGKLVEFTADGNVFNHSSSTVNNQGFDETTGLYWGRWSNGSANVSSATGTEVKNLNNNSAHWVYSVNSVTPVLRSTGVATFTLIGNTNPTDNQGNAGVLGSASLSADFNTQTVDADINLAIDNRTWDAEANDVALNGEAATFAGDFDLVEITDNSTGQATDGTGSLAGFFTGDDQGDLEGAGLVYTLEDGEGVEVEGGVAFEIKDEPRN